MVLDLRAGFVRQPAGLAEQLDGAIDELAGHEPIGGELSAGYGNQTIFIPDGMLARFLGGVRFASIDHGTQP